MLPLFRSPLLYSLSFGTIYPPPSSFSPSFSVSRVRLADGLSRPEYPFKVNSNTSGCDQNGETRTQSTTLSFWGARFECLATKLATAGRRNGRQKLPATFCLPACLVYDPSPPHPFSLSHLLYTRGLDSDSLRKYRRTLCVTQLQILPLPFLSLPHAIPLDLRFCSNLLLPPRSKVGQRPSSRKPKLVGWLFLFNADYGRSLVAGIPSGDKFVRLSFERILSNPASTDTSCYHPFSGGERSHDKFQRSR